MTTTETRYRELKRKREEKESGKTNQIQQKKTQKKNKVKTIRKYCAIWVCAYIHIEFYSYGK